MIRKRVQDLRGRLQRSHAALLTEWRGAGEPVTDELLWRWIKAKRGVEAAESALLTHAQWRVSLGRIETVSHRPYFKAEPWVPGVVVHY